MFDYEIHQSQPS